MIKARIRWCSCRVEIILTLGKLLRLWFCFLLHSILSQTSYRTYKIISSYELARPIMGTIFLVILYIIYIRDSQLNRPESVSFIILSLANYGTCKFCSYNPVKKAERNCEIAARTLCLRVRRYASLYSSGKKSRFPGNISVLEFFSIESSLKGISSDFESNKEY